MLDKTQTHSLAPADYSLDERLPPDVVARSSGRLGSYREYPVFSATWLKRRSLIFVPIAICVALGQAALVAAGLRDVKLGLQCAAVAVPIWVLIVTAGPALATLVRHRRWPFKFERIGVLAAVAAGIALSFAGQYVANDFSRKVVAPRAHAGSAPSTVPTPSPLLIGFIVAWQFGLFYCLGGGLALPTYFGEQRRWREVRRARELEAVMQQKREADMRLAVLQAQVEPHFLFNTLASVHSLIRTNPERAEATIEALVDHLRATMPKLRAGVGSAPSTLGEQVDICSSYLEVMRLRIGKRLRYTIDLPDSLKEHPFPPLMLISLVENAIKHGIEPSQTGGNVVIAAKIEGHDDARQLAVSVIDDGVGLKPGSGGGVGLDNIRAQLKNRFGEQGGLAIRGRTVGGVEATIRVPYVETRQ